MSSVEYLKDNAGRTYGRLEHNEVLDRTMAQDAGGRNLGYYDRRLNETRRIDGRRLGSGDLTFRLIDEER